MWKKKTLTNAGRKHDINAPKIRLFIFTFNGRWRLGRVLAKPFCSDFPSSLFPHFFLSYFLSLSGSRKFKEGCWTSLETYNGEVRRDIGCGCQNCCKISLSLSTHGSPVLPSSGESWRPTLRPPRRRRLRYRGCEQPGGGVWWFGSQYENGDRY